MITSKLSRHTVVLIDFVFDHITLSILSMITTPFVYEYSENMNSSFVEFHIDITFLLNIIRCSKEIPSFRFSFNTNVLKLYKTKLRKNMYFPYSKI